MNSSNAPENRDMWLINHWQTRALKAETALGEIAWSNDSQWQADRAKATLAAKQSSPTVQAQEAPAVPADSEEIMDMADEMAAAYCKWQDSMSNLKPGCDTCLTFKEAYFDSRQALRTALAARHPTSSTEGEVHAR